MESTRQFNKGTKLQPSCSLINRGLLQRKCACGKSVQAGGECVECRKKRLGLQRKAADPQADSAFAPPVVHEVLRSPGRPLDSETRAFMEPRFGHDFSHVRVHTGEKAAESARAVNASAYTVGRDIVFDAGHYAPLEQAGRRLLAHELAHVKQQGQGQVSGELPVAQPGSPAEREADAVEMGKWEASPKETGKLPLAVARRGPVARPPVRPQTRSPVRTRERLYIPDQYDTSLEAAFARDRLRSERGRIIANEETPSATLERGGKPPNFVSYAGEGSSIGTYGQVRFTRYEFHILDAIEYEVMMAKTERDLDSVRMKYMPEVELPEDFRELMRLKPIYSQRFTIDSSLDPDGSKRMEVYADAVAEKAFETPFALAAVALSEEATRRRRKLSAYPICWPLQLGPPYQLLFIRTKSERDDNMARQARMQVRWREEQGDLDARRFHVHHVTPLFLGGIDNLQTNGTLLPASIHLKGHRVLQFQPQLLAPPGPLAPLPIDIYRHPPGIIYEFVGFKKEAHETC